VVQAGQWLVVANVAPLAGTQAYSVLVQVRDNGWSYDSQVRSDVFCHPDVRCFYLTANKTAYIYITKAFDQSEPRNRLLG